MQAIVNIIFEVMLWVLNPISSLVLTAPSSWSLDSGTRDALPFLSAHVGSVMAPPVPPRNFPPGKTAPSYARKKYSIK